MNVVANIQWMWYVSILWRFFGGLMRALAARGLGLIVPRRGRRRARHMFLRNAEDLAKQAAGGGGDLDSPQAGPRKEKRQN
jgi:hypothetical protein